MATYYVDDATGLDTDTGLTEALAFKTIQKAADSVSLGDTVYIKSTNDYLEMVTTATAGQSTNPIRWIGYTSTPGDNGKCTIDGASTRANGILGNHNYQIFQNIIVKDTTSHGFYQNFADYEGYYNCEARGCGGKGFMADDYCQWHNCIADDCLEGIDLGRYSSAYNCTMSNNTTYGADGTDNLGVSFFHCIFAGNGTYEYRGSYGTNFYGCTFDGKSPAGTHYGIYSVSGPHNIVNCIFYNCDTAIHVTGYKQAGGGNNCFYGNNSDSPIWTPEYDPDGSVTTDPDFVDDANGDYRLNSTSPCIGAGRGGYADIGALQYDWSGDVGGGQVVIAG